MESVRKLERNLTKCTTPVELSQHITESIQDLQETNDETKKTIIHVQLCQTVIKCSNELIAYDDFDATRLLMCMGHVRGLEIIFNNLSFASIPSSQWLEQAVINIMKNGTFDEILYNQSHVTTNGQLLITQKSLINGIVRCPDLFAAKREKLISPYLLPVKYFASLSRHFFNCLNYIYTSGYKVSETISITFLAHLLGKISFLGHRESFFSYFCKELEKVTKENQLWRKLSHDLFTNVPQQHLEATLDGVLHHVTPSLQYGHHSPPLWNILGDLPLSNSHAKYLCTHKYVTLRPLSDPRTLVGYLACNDKIKELLMDAILLALSLWSDKSSLRHMTNSLHLNLSGIIVLGIKLFDVSTLKESQLTELRGLLMQGIQVHLESPVNEIKYLGMATGEYLMNLLQPTKEPLKFDYPLSESIEWLKSFIRPISEQEEELLKKRDKQSVINQEEEEEEDKEKEETSKNERFGKGFVQSTLTNNDDSDDDDLQPYDMSNDTDNSVAPLPRYLRTCMEGLQAKNDFPKHSAALKALKGLIESRLPDLSELCIELVKILLHLEDMYSISEFTQLRHEGLLLLTHACPIKVAPYLCEQFYSPHYTLSQRFDILEVLTGAAQKLSTPSSSSSIKEHSLKGGVKGDVMKPWQQVVEERIKSKTRQISKGGKKLEGTPNQFSAVCGNFFFPLLTNYDSSVPCFNRSEQNGLLLGQLLHSVGSIIHLSLHCPLVPVMASNLIEFCWSFQYHSHIAVRRSILYCMSCMLSVISPNDIHILLESGLNEILLWMKDIAINDASEQCRQLASLSLSLFNESIKT